MSAPVSESGVNVTAASVDERMALMERNLDEVIGGDAVRAIMEERSLKLYWGTATTGKPHIAYFVPICKLADFLRAGCEVTVLFADLHAYLDNMKAPWDLLRLRTQYYEEVIKGMLESIGVDLSGLKFVRGTEYQLSEKYTLDVYRLSSLVTERDAKKAGAEVVKQVKHPLLSGLLYPGLQALDEEYLGVDAQFGGVDQRKIFMFADKYLPALGYRKRAHFMNPMVPGLTGKKMSSSEQNSKIDILDSAEDVSRKMRKAFCAEGEVDGNGVLSFAKCVIFPAFDEPFTVPRPDADGGDATFATYADLEAAFVAKTLHPMHLKPAVAAAINRLLAPVRAKFERPELAELARQAYPEEAAAAAAAASGAGAGAGASADAAEAVRSDLPAVCRLDLRVGRVVSAEADPHRNLIYYLKVDVGEAEPRDVAAGLRAHYTAEQLAGRAVVAVCNLKPRPMGKTFTSNAMLLCATQGKGNAATVELLSPPEASAPGTVVRAEGLPDPVPDASVNPTRKNSAFVKSLATMATDADRRVCFEGGPLVTDAGPVVAATLAGAKIA